MIVLYRVVSGTTRYGMLSTDGPAALPDGLPIMVPMPLAIGWALLAIAMHRSAGLTATVIGCQLFTVIALTMLDRAHDVTQTQAQFAVLALAGAALGSLFCLNSASKGTYTPLEERSSTSLPERETRSRRR